MSWKFTISEDSKRWRRAAREVVEMFGRAYDAAKRGRR